MLNTAIDFSGFNSRSNTIRGDRVEEIFEQKERNRPIKITDIAITKVPLVHIAGFLESEDKYISEMHRKLLEISKQNNDSKEVGIMVDIIDWTIWPIIGDSQQVETRDNPDAYKALKTNRKHTLLFMHNHPSTGTFSGVDFKTFCNNQSLYAMTVVGNDGCVYVLVKKNDFDKDKALMYYHNLALNKYKKYKNNGTMAMKELLKNAQSIGLIYSKGGR